MQGNEEAQQKKQGCAGDRGGEITEQTERERREKKEEEKKEEKKKDYRAKFSVRHWTHTPPR